MVRSKLLFFPLMRTCTVGETEKLDVLNSTPRGGERKREVAVQPSDTDGLAMGDGSHVTQKSGHFVCPNLLMDPHDAEGNASEVAGTGAKSEIEDIRPP